MARFALLVALALSLALIPALSGVASADYCNADDPPPQPVAGTMTINSDGGVVNRIVAIGASFPDQRPYKAGSLHFEVTGPEGTSTLPPESGGADETGGGANFPPKVAGRYTATASNTYVACVHSEDGSEVLVTDTAGPQSIDIA